MPDRSGRSSTRYAIPEGASGLAFDGTWLYCGIYGPDGGRVYQIDPATGVSTLLFTGPHGRRLRPDVRRRVPLDDRSSRQQLGARGRHEARLERHAARPVRPARRTTCPGIACDDGEFWVTRYYPDPGHVYLLDGAGAILDEFDAPDNQPWDVCLENGNLWIADYWGDALYKIDPATGAVLESHPSEGVDPAGIVWDGQHLWYCDNGEGGNDFLYKVDSAGRRHAADRHSRVAVTTTGRSRSATRRAWNLTVHNSGDAALEITAVTFDPSGGLSCPANFPVTIAPGDERRAADRVRTGARSARSTRRRPSLSNDPVHPERGARPDGSRRLSRADDRRARGKPRLRRRARRRAHPVVHGGHATRATRC